ncbi:hypothetical protein [Bifidobacterium choloepi]|uniref:Uncharacterized protein n=1 Tax=Bifidobacterium choloepi TaxID=2614131 RepID=A0A6I5NBA4_9BIFI|nr:hypothetical protein [Bifidobacterium choloepi]NEG69760.1 hypothetical protein [Bifidobacterium choloepi]
MTVHQIILFVEFFFLFAAVRLSVDQIGRLPIMPVSAAFVTGVSCVFPDELEARSCSGGARRDLPSSLPDKLEAGSCFRGLKRDLLSNFPDELEAGTCFGGLGRDLPSSLPDKLERRSRFEGV